MTPELQAERQRLRQQLAQYRQGLQEQQHELAEEVLSYRSMVLDTYRKASKAAQLGTTGLLVLGGLYIVYRLTSWIWRKPPAEEGPRIVVRAPSESAIVREIKAGIASFLLAIAKKELLRIMEQWRAKQEAAQPERK